MEYVRNMTRRCVEHVQVYGIYLEHVWHISGTCIEAYGTCMGHVWNMNDICIGYEWNQMYGICSEYV